jgi:hypothetical protein
MRQQGVERDPDHGRYPAPSWVDCEHQSPATYPPSMDSEWGKGAFSRWQNVTLASGNVMWFTVTSSR